VTDQLGFTSTTIQRLRRLHGRRSSRSTEGAFVVEGPVLVAEAVAAGWEVEGQFVAPGVAPVDGAGPVYELAPGVAERISATDTPPGLFAVVRTREHTAAVLDQAGFVLVADGLTDPGNLGTIMRSAEACGVEAVVVTPGTVDWLNPKVVRASAGALFHVPIVAASLDAARRGGLALVGTSSHQGVAHTAYDWTGRVAIVLGNEAHGLADDAPVDAWVRIAHRGRAESLNVAMAATVVAFEAARARDRL
jgi:TrmH family RNA methyltransferase